MDTVIIFAVIIGLFLAVCIRCFIAEGAERKRFIVNLRRNYGKKRERRDTLPERYYFLGKYFEKHRGAYVIDEITWNDLSLLSVFDRINYTHSSCGEEYLIYRLRSPELSEGELSLSSDEEALIRYFEEHEEERVKLQTAFAKIGYTGKYSLYQYLDFLDTLSGRSNALHFIWLSVYAFGIGMLFFSPTVGFAMIILNMIIMILTYLKEKSENEPYLTSFSFILKFIRGGQNILKSLPESEENSEIRKRLSEETGKLMSVRAHSAFIDKSERATGGDPMSAIGDYLKMITHLDLIEFNMILKAVSSHVSDIDELYTTMGYLEYILSVGEYRRSLDKYTLPKFGGKGINAVNISHPLLEDAVPCSFSEEKGVLVTGSNASGKSTFLRNVALCAVLAQSVHTVPGDKYEAEFFRIYSSMSLSDDLSAGDSYYMAEIKALKRIIDAESSKGPRILCFVDEVLRGTNTVERIAASTKIMENFTCKNVFCFAATHDIELTYLLEKIYHNFHFDEEICNGDIHFSYMLKEGRATTRNAIKLLEIMGYNEEIIKEAEELAGRFMDTGVWSM